jgi:hypothetical protein
MNRLALILLSTTLTAGGALAQTPVQVTLQDPVRVEPGGIWLFQDRSALEQKAREALFLTSADLEVVKNAPFTGTVVTETSQTLSDGNHITTKTSGFEARDSQGRTRREQALGQIGPVQVDAPKVIFISDPVGQTDYVLEADGKARVLKQRFESAEAVKIAIKTKLALEQEDKTTTKGYRTERRNGEPKRDVEHEDLGTQTMEGVSCHGTRETVTIPAGQIGNELPIVITTETWFSDDVHGVVLKKHSDPRFGDTVYRLTNIKLGEPDASLFKVPGSFKIVKPENRD